MQTSDTLRELTDLYAGHTFGEIEEMFQIASADLAEVKRRVRDGIAQPGELRDARADFIAIRGLKARADRGAI